MTTRLRDENEFTQIMQINYFFERISTALGRQNRVSVLEKDVQTAVPLYVRDNIFDNIF